MATFDIRIERSLNVRCNVALPSLLPDENSCGNLFEDLLPPSSRIFLIPDQHKIKGVLHSFDCLFLSPHQRRKSSWLTSLIQSDSTNPPVTLYLSSSCFFLRLNALRNLCVRDFWAEGYRRNPLFRFQLYDLVIRPWILFDLCRSLYKAAAGSAAFWDDYYFRNSGIEINGSELSWWMNGFK